MTGLKPLPRWKSKTAQHAAKRKANAGLKIIRPKLRNLRMICILIFILKKNLFLIFVLKYRRMKNVLEELSSYLKESRADYLQRDLV